MGKLIAVWGSPDSGKTTFSVKLAEALYNRSRGKSAVIVVFTDIVTPTIPVIFPNFRSEDVFSVGIWFNFLYIKSYFRTCYEILCC